MRQTSESQSKKLQRVSTSWRERGASLSGNLSGSEMVNLECASVGVIEKDRMRGADLGNWRRYVYATMNLRFSVAHIYGDLTDTLHMR